MLHITKISSSKLRQVWFDMEKEGGLEDFKFT